MKQPSSSEFYILENCGAAYSLMRRSSGEEPATTYAFKGTRVHRVLAASAGANELNADEHKTFEELWAKLREQLRLWRAGGGIDDIWNEPEFVFHYETRVLFTGHPDKVIRQGARLFIPDFKTGWHPQDAISATNCQLRSYVALADANISGIEEITVWINKPGKTDPPAVFDRPLIDKAKQWAIDVATRATAPGEKKPTAGPWCHYCSGKVICPLWRNEIDSFAGTVEGMVDQIPDEQLAELAPKLDIAGKVIERLKARLESRVKENPTDFPDWHFKAGRLMSDIESVQKAWAAFKDVFSADSFLEATKLRIGELVELYRGVTGTTHEQARKEVEERLGNNLKRSRTKPMLVYEPKVVRELAIKR